MSCFGYFTLELLWGKLDAHFWHGFLVFVWDFLWRWGCLSVTFLCAFSCSGDRILPPFSVRIQAPAVLVVTLHFTSTHCNKSKAIKVSKFNPKLYFTPRFKLNPSFKQLYLLPLMSPFCFSSIFLLSICSPSVAFAFYCFPSFFFCIFLNHVF